MNPAGLYIAPHLPTVLRGTLLPSHEAQNKQLLRASHLFSQLRGSCLSVRPPLGHCFLARQCGGVRQLRRSRPATPPVGGRSSASAAAARVAALQADIRGPAGRAGRLRAAGTWAVGAAVAPLAPRG